MHLRMEFFYRESSARGGGCPPRLLESRTNARGQTDSTRSHPGKFKQPTRDAKIQSHRLGLANFPARKGRDRQDPHPRARGDAAQGACSPETLNPISSFFSMGRWKEKYNDASRGQFLRLVFPFAFEASRSAAGQRARRRSKWRAINLSGVGRGSVVGRTGNSLEANNVGPGHA